MWKDEVDLLANNENIENTGFDKRKFKRIAKNMGIGCGELKTALKYLP